MSKIDVPKNDVRALSFSAAHSTQMMIFFSLSAPFECTRPFLEIRSRDLHGIRLGRMNFNLHSRTVADLPLFIHIWKTQSDFSQALALFVTCRQKCQDFSVDPDDSA